VKVAALRAKSGLDDWVRNKAGCCVIWRKNFNKSMISVCQMRTVEVDACRRLPRSAKRELFSGAMPREPITLRVWVEAAGSWREMPWKPAEDGRRKNNNHCSVPQSIASQPTSQYRRRLVEFEDRIAINLPQ
jgi:hypothetical protein